MARQSSAAGATGSTAKPGRAASRSTITVTSTIIVSALLLSVVMFAIGDVQHTTTETTTSTATLTVPVVTTVTTTSVIIQMTTLISTGITILGAGSGLNITLTNSTLDIPSSGTGLLAFNVSSGDSGSYYYAVAPNGTMAPVLNSPEWGFPLPNYTLPAGFSASYPNGQMTSNSTTIQIIARISCAGVAPGSYTFDLIVGQVQGYDGSGVTVSYPFEVLVQ